jgi:hypothetical protein
MNTQKETAKEKVAKERREIDYKEAIQALQNAVNEVSELAYDIQALHQIYEEALGALAEKGEVPHYRIPYILAAQNDRLIEMLNAMDETTALLATAIGI